jgi:tetrahydromethanopterin S-methyltransferase subunit C
VSTTSTCASTWLPSSWSHLWIAALKIGILSWMFIYFCSFVKNASKAQADSVSSGD